MVASFAVNLAGCGGPGDRPEIGQVTGTVTMDGAPLKGVQVMFSPTQGRPATGVTNAEGKYKLRYVRETFGTKIGKNSVQIGATEGEDEPESGDDATPTKKKKGGKVQIPARYNTKTELEADVKAGENVFDFKLESK
jgi:hypothetical protein